MTMVENRSAVTFGTVGTNTTVAPAATTVNLVVDPVATPTATPTEVVRPRRRAPKERHRHAAFLGAAFLDEMVPGWHRRINKESLKLSSSYSCICGQLLGDFTYFYRGTLYAEGVKWLDVTKPQHSRATSNALGFTANSAADYKVLDFAWKHEINVRLRQDHRAA